MLASTDAQVGIRYALKSMELADRAGADPLIRSIALYHLW
jgi:hypothetical protein